MAEKSPRARSKILHGRLLPIGAPVTSPCILEVSSRHDPTHGPGFPGSTPEEPDAMTDHLTLFSHSHSPSQARAKRDSRSAKPMAASASDMAVKRSHEVSLDAEPHSALQDSKMPVTDCRKTVAKKDIGRQVTMSNDDLYRHRPSYLKADPESFVDAYNEFRGLGNYHDNPIEGGITGLMAKIRKNGRPYNSSIPGSDYPRHKTVYMLAKVLEERADTTGLPLETILDELESERRDHVGPNDPFAWVFLSARAGCEYPSSKFTLSGSPGCTSGNKQPSAKNKKASAASSTPRKRQPTTQDVNPAGPRRLRSEAKAREVKATEEPKPDEQQLVPPKPYISLDKLPGDTPYIEETAFLYHDPPNDVPLLPLPRPPPGPAIPSDVTCKWRYEGFGNRVLRADFTTVATIPPADLKFLRQAMQCDYIALVCDGLLQTEPSKEDFTWTRDHIVAELGSDTYYHKYRRFTRVSESHVYKEQDGYTSLTAKEYMRYLELREAADAATVSGEVDPTKLSFQYTCNTDKCLEKNGSVCPGHTIDDVRKESVYMTDVELPTYLHRLHGEFLESFKLPEALPGSDWCIMNAMTPSTRPFMGPNLYATPAGGFTHLHLDGHGSVDSGHVCLSGYNEVLLMRRLTERHKVNAVNILNETVGGEYSPLYNLPHDDENDKPGWMNSITIEKWEKMGYEPICIVLKPGQFIHLNKGRLHAFRKLTRDKLPANDCHYKLRESVIQSLGSNPAPTCISIAWDWNFVGSGSDGINRETATTVEALQRCRLKKVKALAPIGRSVLSMGAYIMDAHGKQARLISGTRALVDAPNDSLATIARGILPSLKAVVQRELSSFDRALEAAKERAAMFGGSPSRGHELVRVDVPDIQKDPLSASIDARGNDYYCKSCNTELANAYYRCNGCERIFQKDYMICTECYISGAHTEQQSDAPAVTYLSHCGFLSGNVKGRCTKANCTACLICKHGSCCSCRCHSNFSQHLRMFRPNQLEDVVRAVTEVAGDPIEYANETFVRLMYGADPVGKGYDDLCKLVTAKDPDHCKKGPADFHAVHAGTSASCPIELG